MIRKKILGKLQREAKKQGGVRELSSRSGLNRNHLYRTLKGTKDVRLKTLVKICRALELSLDIKPAKT